MTLQPQKAAGFSIVGIVVLVAVVLILGAVGWRMWEADQIPKSNPSSTSEQAYLGDVVYTPSLGSEKYPRVFLSTQSLSEKAQECTSSSGAPPLGSIMTIKESASELGQPLVPNGKNVIKLEDTFVVLISPQSPCSTDPEVEELATRQRAAFAESFKTVQLDR